ncbi:MAG: STAS domain-containing protein [Chloroflexus sp.]
MKHLFSRFLHIRHDDEEMRQRGRNVVIIATGLLTINVLIFLFLLGSPPLALDLLIATFLSVVLHSGIIILARQGRVNLAGWLIIVLALAGAIVATFVMPQRPIAMFFSTTPVLAATLLRFRGLVIVTIMVFFTFLVVAFGIPATPVDLTTSSFLQSAAILCLFISLISFVQSAGNEALHQRLQAALQAAKHTAEQLQTLNAELDLRVHMQTAALQESMLELEERAEQQNRLLAEVIAQRNVIRQLSVPVLPVGYDALTMPLIGTIDHDRLRVILQRALEHIEAQRARWLILDVTGVPVIDTEVASGFLQLVQSARLLGAEVVLVGVHPEVAQTMISLGVELPVSHVFTDLAAAIAYVQKHQRSISTPVTTRNTVQS